MKSRSVCPNCKAVLEFDRATIGNTVKCPICKYTGNVANFKELEPPTEVHPSTGKLYQPGKLEWLESDAQWLEKEKTVDLKRGMNTLGRKSPNSDANTQLPTADSFMSRNHANIEVIMKADGVFEHRLSDTGSKNGTFHNDERLEKGDVIILVPGDRIKLGHTVFKFISS